MSEVKTKMARNITWLAISCACLIALLGFGARSALGFFNYPCYRIRVGIARHLHWRWRYKTWHGAWVSPCRAPGSVEYRTSRPGLTYGLVDRRCSGGFVAVVRRLIKEQAVVRHEILQGE